MNIFFFSSINGYVISTKNYDHPGECSPEKDCLG